MTLEAAGFAIVRLLDPEELGTKGMGTEGLDIGELDTDELCSGLQPVLITLSTSKAAQVRLGLSVSNSITIVVIPYFNVSE
ncbi:hypothetical protein [Shewanella sairae]|uniref:hypothetical protein n=1 Tax=Shewanella sairae TaxID=190310 RepID=UPI001C7E26D9|nr:hypothetical protein [Shewanella sairae]MCL1130385.1 hypothetical protein [Shewanella sairae]